jgi:site-specific DNA-methyltransferase (adenine-specific)
VNETNVIIEADSLKLMAEMPEASVDLVLTDPPYGVTACEWDKSPVDIAEFWRQVLRVCRKRVVVTATQPFATDLICGNRKGFKWDDVWVKPPCSMMTKGRPLRSHESILVFGSGPFNPQACEAVNLFAKIGQVKNLNSVAPHRTYGLKDYRRDTITETGERQPRSVFYFGRPKNNQFTKRNQFHPTEKPVALFEYLVKTFSNEGDLVLDPFAGAGATALACAITGRRWVCIEKERKYVDIARRRLANGVQAELCTAYSALCVNTANNCIREDR